MKKSNEERTQTGTGGESVCTHALPRVRVAVDTYTKKNEGEANTREDTRGRGTMTRKKYERITRDQ
jgi:hypothetical protein